MVKIREMMDNFSGVDDITAELIRVILVELYLNSLNYDEEDDNLFRGLLNTHLEDYDNIINKLTLLYPYAANKINFAEILDNLLGSMYYYPRDLKMGRETYLTNAAFAIGTSFITYVIGMNSGMENFEKDNHILN